MARYSFQGTFRDGQGNIVSGGQVIVYPAGTTTAATIYADDTTVDVSPYVESDSNGYFIFYVDDGDYDATQLFDIQLSKTGYTTKTYPDIAVIAGMVTDATIKTTDVTTNDVSATKHGWAPKLSDSATDFLDGKGNWDKVSDADLEITDVTTNNASTSAHGFLKKLDNDATHFMDGTGAWDTVKDSDLALTDITDNDVSTTKHGFVPKLPDSSTQFLNGTGNWTTPSGGGGGGSVRQTVLSASISSGVPNYISAGTGLAVNIAATSKPIRIAFAAGFGENGAVDYVGTVDTDTSISSLTANATNYLYAERNPSTGAITLGKTTVQPVYSYSPPAHASGQYWFSISEMTMYLSNGSDTWTAKQVVFLGEAVTDGSGVTSVANYAIRGKYTGVWANCAFSPSTNYSLTHNLGVAPRKWRLQLLNVAAQWGYTPGDIALAMGAYNAGTYVTGTPYNGVGASRRNSVYFRILTDGMKVLNLTISTTPELITNAKWKYRLEAERGW